MQFAYGTTRWVILTDNHAIKIARFRPLRPLMRLVDAVTKKEVKEALGQHHSNPLFAIIKYLLAGMVANRYEYNLYKRYQDESLAPTLFTFFWIVNIQVRGSVATDSDVQNCKLTPLLNKLKDIQHDVLEAGQFCIIGDKVCIADYGSAGMVDIMSQHNT